MLITLKAKSFKTFNTNRQIKSAPFFVQFSLDFTYLIVHVVPSHLANSQNLLGVSQDMSFCRKKGVQANRFFSCQRTTKPISIYVHISHIVIVSPLSICKLHQGVSNRHARTSVLCKAASFLQIRWVEEHFNPRLFNPKLLPQTFQPQTFQP